MAEIKFTKSHEWAKIEGDTAVAGITDYAQKELGDVVFIELPKVGARVTGGGRIGTIESTKAASELYAPLSGEIIAVNSDLAKNPQWVNEDAMGKGWMIKIKLNKKDEAAGLLDEAAYQKHVAQEKH